MHVRTREQTQVLAACSSVVLWVVGILLFLGIGNRELEHLGFLLIVIAATVTVLGMLHSWQLRMHRSFVHGYHAGFHDGAGQVRSSTDRNCDVLEFSEVKARRMSKLG